MKKFFTIWFQILFSLLVISVITLLYFMWKGDNGAWEISYKVQEFFTFSYGYLMGISWMPFAIMWFKIYMNNSAYKRGTIVEYKNEQRDKIARKKEIQGKIVVGKVDEARILIESYERRYGEKYE